MDTQEDYFETVNNEDSEGSSDDGIAQEDEYDDCVRIVSKGFSTEKKMPLMSVTLEWT